MSSSTLPSSITSAKLHVSVGNETYEQTISSAT